MNQHYKYWDFEKNTQNFLFQFSDKKKPIESELKQKIISDLADLMPENEVEAYFNNQSNIFQEYSYTLCVYDKRKNKYVGIFGSKLYEVGQISFLYLWTLFIATELQSTSLFYNAVFQHIQRINALNKIPNYIVTKSFHPTVYKLFYKLKSLFKVELFPDLNKNNVNNSLLKEAEIIANKIAGNATLDKETGALVNGQDTAGMNERAKNFYPSRPQSSNCQVNEFFEKALGTYDQLLCILKMPHYEVLMDCIDFIQSKTKAEQ